jgi:site-specific DNA-cytosine methylase
VGAPKKMIGVELFAGAGGCPWARLGVDVQVAIEIRASACQTYAKNHPSTKLISRDIRHVHPIDMPRRDRELVIFGGPPCQGFSTSNQRTRTRDNEKNWLFLEFLRFVDLMKPEWVVFENVAGIVHTDGGYFIRRFEDHLKRLRTEYHPHCSTRLTLACRSDAPDFFWSERARKIHPSSPRRRKPDRRSLYAKRLEASLC